MTDKFSEIFQSLPEATQDKICEGLAKEFTGLVGKNNLFPNYETHNITVKKEDILK